MKNSKGFGLVEIIIVTAITTAALTAFAQAGVVALRLLRSQKENLEAMLLAQEGMEAVRSLRDESWTNNITSLTNGTTYYPVVENGKWKLLTVSPGAINGKYTRTLTFSQVYRNAQDDIASSGTADSGTRKVTSAISWGAKQAVISAYITNFLSSLNNTTETKTIYFETPATDTNLANFPSNNAGDGDPGQSFTTSSASLQATRIDLFLRRTTSQPSDIYAEIRTSATGAVLGTSQTINSSTIATTSAVWVEFRFQPSVALAASTSYVIRLRSTPSSTDVGSTSAGTIDWIYQQTPSSPYSGGVARRYIGRLSNAADAGQQLDQYDFGFRLYSL